MISIVIGLTILLLGCQRSEDNQTTKTKNDNFRIVPTTVALTMTLDKLDLPIVGKPSTYKTLPSRYKGIPEVGQPMAPNVEAVKQLNPTHVLSVTTIQDEMKPFYKQLNMKGYYYDYDSLAGMQRSITQLGDQFNRKSQAKKLNDHLEKVKNDIKDKVKRQKTHPKVLILMGVPGSYLVATDRSYIGDLVKIAGGQNVIKDQNRQYISSNTENLLNVDPDIILRLPHGLPDEVKKMFEKEFKHNDIWKHFKAVKNNQVYDLEEIPFGITANVDADKAMTDLYHLFYEQR